jgi:SAM-dependent methyltransferase
MQHRVRRSMLRHTIAGPADGRGFLFRRCLPPPLCNRGIGCSMSPPEPAMRLGWRFPSSAPRASSSARTSRPKCLRARGRLYGLPFLPVAADGQALPFRDGTFDAVICQLGLQFFTDPASGVREFRRVLRKNGSVSICVISTPDRAPMWGILADVLSRFLPELHAVLFLSFALNDPSRLEAMLAGAGFRDVRVERATRQDSFESFADYWEPIEVGVGSIPQTYLRLSPVDRRAVREEVQSRLSPFASNGKLSMSVEMLIGSGRV